MGKSVTSTHPPIHQPEPTMSTKTKFFRIGTEGATTDGRTIERAHLQQMAASYNQKTYNARINLEHLKGLLPDGPFKRYGDVVALKTEEVDGKMVLLAQIDPTEDLVALTQARQKIHTSMEIDPNFASTGSAYLVGLAITDDPASLGTDMLKFCAGAAHNPLAARKLNAGTLFSEAEEARIELEAVQAQANDEARGMLDSLMKFLRGGAQQAAQTPAAQALTNQPAPPAGSQPAAQPAATAPAQDGAHLYQAMTQMVDMQKQVFDRLDELAQKVEQQGQTIQTLSDTPATTTPRPVATGQSGYKQEF